jgi:hypothetical protein
MFKWVGMTRVSALWAAKRHDRSLSGQAAWVVYRPVLTRRRLREGLR